jgi:serine phosphatase RsbU (regulator of sigma subunit)
MLPDAWRQWLTRKDHTALYYSHIPLSQVRLLYAAVFCLFSTIALFNDLINFGKYPYLIAILNAIACGLVAVAYVLVATRYRYSWYWMAILSILQFPYWFAFDRFAHFLGNALHLQEVPSPQGIRVAAIAMLVLVMLSYSFFIGFISRQGAAAYRIQNELALAHGIQQTLVPPFTLRSARYEIYGISKPSEKVGGDLVDALELANGDAIAYLGDIAGHGLQAGILMGMLKTATRTALLDAGEREPNRTLPVLLDRLNTVLPKVKEAHMYATFSAFRLCADGAVFYALAASTPVLHWHGDGRAMSKVEEEQFPLGLLPVPQFDGRRLQMEPGELLVVATDGILEVCNKTGEEFGVEQLERTIATHVSAALPELAGKILEAANSFGKQIDDQTILIVRRL